MADNRDLDKKIFELIQLKGTDSPVWADGTHHRELVLWGTGLRIGQLFKDGVVTYTLVDHTTRGLYSARGPNAEECQREGYHAGGWGGDIARQLEIARHEARQRDLF